MLSRILGNGLWALVNLALVFGSLKEIPALLNLADGVIWIMMVLSWGVLVIIAMLTASVGVGMDDQSIKAYESLTKMVAQVRGKSKPRKTASTIQMIITVCSIAIAGWVVTAVLYCISSVLLRLAFEVAIGRLDDIDNWKSGQTAT